MKKQILFMLAIFSGITAVAQDSTDCFLNANFTYTISGSTINFTNTSTGEPDWPNYSWTIDGLTSSEENPDFPTDEFEESEMVCLTVYDSLETCVDSYCMTLYFTEDSLGDSTDCALIASFTYTVEDGNLILTNTSADEPAWPFYNWTVDGLSSWEENPTFPTADFEDSEEICLTVYDSLEDCSDTYCVTIYLEDDSTWSDSTMSIVTYDRLYAEIYPNPTKDFLNLRVYNTTGPVQIVIYNIMGESVRFEPLPSNGVNNTLDLSMLESGVYVIHIINEDYPTHHLQQKLIKQ